MALFKKTNVKIFSKPASKSTPESNYWRKLGTPIILKEFGAIDYIDFSRVEPYYLAITCSVRVQIYNPFTKAVHKTLTKFKESAYGAKFRSDGNLVVSGDEEGLVKLFDANSRSLLRVFRDHSSPVHRVDFTADKQHVVSFSDDKTSKLWDIASESVISTYYEHTDYVRAGTASPIAPTVFVSGGYDRKACLYDSRTGTKAVYVVDHGFPVESVLFLPTGGIFITAGGTEINVWDALAGGKLLSRINNHHKTVTCMCLGRNGNRLLSGSLDKHVKVYDVSTYRVVHNFDYQSPILSIGLSPNNETFAVGTVDGLVSISRREEDPQDDTIVRKHLPVRYRSNRVPNTDLVVPAEKRVGQSRHDIFLRKFQYAKALDCVLSPHFLHKAPGVTVSVMQELIRRKGLTNALQNKSHKMVLALLRFLIRYIGDYKFTPVLLDVTNTLLDVSDTKYQKGFPVLWGRLTEKVQEEMDLAETLGELSGAIEMLQSASLVTPPESTAEHLLPSKPSTNHSISISV